MKILLMSVKAGYGHHSTANAIIEKFTQNGHECEMLDIFDYINPHLGNTIQDGYLFLTKYLSVPYGKVYATMADIDTPYRKLSVTNIMSKYVSKKLQAYVRQYNPDLIIGTHSYAGVVMSIMREKRITDCPLVGIVTDFTVHPFWESTALDYYVIPDARLSYEMTRKGIAKEKLLPIGIPIRRRFETKMDRDTACKKLGIENKRTVLLMMGSMGYGNIKKTLLEIDECDEDFQVLCICGSNTRMKKAISKYSWKKNIMPYGFVDTIDEMMDACDVIISKPGGLTTSEALAKGLAMIMVNPIPGQEDRNLMFLLNNGVAMGVNDNYTMSDALHQLFGTSDRLYELKECVAKMGKPLATQNLYEFCEKNFFSKSQEIENSLPQR
ncbi:MAG: glycosyltransferase [Clostridia bacterium]|nr:glycosyltransferase [Clostridia bacterium]